MTLHKSLTQSIKAFLDHASRKPTNRRPCPNCGLIMEYRILAFSLWGSDGTWEVPVPFCPECDT